MISVFEEDQISIGDWFKIWYVTNDDVVIKLAANSAVKGAADGSILEMIAININRNFDLFSIYNIYNSSNYSTVII